MLFDNAKALFVDNPMLGEFARTRRYAVREGATAVKIVIAILAVLYVLTLLIAYRSPNDGTGLTFNLQIGIMTVLAPLLMLGSVSGEREKATWDALMLTRLTVGQIIVGKLSWRLLLLGMLMVLTWLVVGLSGLLNSLVPFDQMVWLELALLSWAVSLVTFTFWISSITRGVATTTCIVGVVLLAFLCVGPQILSLYNLDETTIDTLLWPNPFYSLDKIVNHFSVPSSYDIFEATTLKFVIMAVYRIQDTWDEIRLYLASSMLFLLLTGINLMRSNEALRKQEKQTGTESASPADPVLADVRLQPARILLDIVDRTTSRTSYPSSSRKFFLNPVFIRDIRAQIRSRKLYQSLGGFVSVLLLVAIVEYARSTAPGSASGTDDIVEMQSRMESVYHAVFLAVAGLLALIAPALTATSITSERQRLTLDLLLTTPMTAGQLLVGKLYSSTAYLILLLIVALPVSSLCVIVGGSSIGDIVQSYSMLLTDSLVIASVGIYCSANCRTNMRAITWTYGVVAASLCLSGWASGFASQVEGLSTDPGLSSALLSLNPFLAMGMLQNSTTSFSAFGLQVPIYVGNVVAGALISRILVTSASARLGANAEVTVASPRRQILVFTAIAAVATTKMIAPNIYFAGGFGQYNPEEVVLGVATGAFLVAALFFPGLFTPAARNDQADQIDTRAYRPSRAFQPDHSGSLPYFHLWLLVLFSSSVITLLAVLPTHQTWPIYFTTITYVHAVLSGKAVVSFMFYFSGVGYLFWSLSRRAASFTSNLGLARLLSAGFYILITLGPWAVFNALGLFDDFNAKLWNNPFAHAWILYPFYVSNPDYYYLTGTIHTDYKTWMYSGVISYDLGTIAYWPWRAVAPGVMASRKQGY